MRQRKEAYLDHLEAADERIALVSACDKLHTARCNVADLRVRLPSVGSVQRGNPEDQIWYYDGVFQALRSKVPAPLADELGMTVAAIRAEAGADRCAAAGHQSP